MDAITALISRVSSPRLTEPSPTPEQLELLFQAAFRAADHASLRPWRYLVIEGEGRHSLGELFLKAALADKPELDAQQQQKYLQMPLRAPMIVAPIAVFKEHPKVPKQEQLLSAGAGVQNLLTAAYALGIGAYWRTGDAAYKEKVSEGLRLKANEELLGFVYLGSPNGPQKPVPQRNTEDYVSQWKDS